MKPREAHWSTDLKVFEQPDTTLVIQAPLPGFNAWPILHSIPGRGDVWQARSPRPPGEEPANE